MARIVLGLATSHTPQLSSPADMWPQHGENDRRNPWLFNLRGEHVTFDELLSGASPSLALEIEPHKQRQRYDAVQRAVAHLQEALEAAAPEVVVIFGDDQAEIFPDDFRPALMIHWGDTVPNMPNLFTRAPYEAGRAAGWAYGQEQATIRVSSGLAGHIVACLMDAGFDLAQSQRLDPGVGLGHAFGFIFGRIMNGKSIPLVPVIINTLYPPNVPAAYRCYELGKAVRTAIESWPEDLRVAVVGSGGLSHFVIDEELDQRFIKALRTKDAASMAALPRERLQSGTGEIRSWIAAAAALEPLNVEFMEYQPCYRSAAGTGVAMGFTVWK